VPVPRGVQILIIRRVHHLQLKPNKADLRIEDSLIHLLLPITRLLVRGGIGIDELVRAAKRAYLSEAVEAVTRQDGKANISRLSVATGMTRKEVSILLGESQQDRRATETRRSGQQRALRVLRGWLTDPRFQNRRGRPGDLPYRGKRSSFSLLVRFYGGDVTPKSVLRELERMGIVDTTSAGALRLRHSRSRGNTEADYKLADLARMFEDFAAAVNCSTSGPEGAAFVGFRDFTAFSASDAAYSMRRFSRRAAALLEDFQRWSIGREAGRTVSRQQQEAMRIGLGVYLLRSDSPPARKRSALAGMANRRKAKGGG
jgi:hypothetical protein